MTVFTHHRAGWGLASIFAFAMFFALSPHWPASEAAYFAIRLPLGIVALAGMVVLLGSPYREIIQREAPLRRVLTGKTDLDERELALRDRAHGMTYYVFVAMVLTGLLIMEVGKDLGHPPFASPIRMMVPVAWFAFALPIILLEWFEPAHLWSAPLEEEDAAEPHFSTGDRAAREERP